MPRRPTKTATSPVEISYRVRSPSGEPIEGIDILIDGRPLETRAAEAMPDENEIASISVPIPQHDVEIGLIARTKTGASEVKIVKVKWDGAFAEMLKPKEVAPASAPEQPRRRPDDHRPQPGDMSPTSPSGPGGG